VTTTAPEPTATRQAAELPKIVSVDDHVIEPPGVWLDRLPARYQRRHSRPLCIGQKQRWFLLRLTAQESDVSFSFTHTSEPEFDGWRWSNYWEPVREVIYFKRPVYVRMLTELATFAFPDGAPPLPEWWQSEISAAAEN
jgi:putative (di)nucleoside polyphosphate hydrolase